MRRFARQLATAWILGGLACAAGCATVGSAPNGTLRIGCSNLYAKYELPAQLASFRSQFPAVEIHLKTGFSQEIYQQLLHGSIHLGIIRGDYNWPGKRQLLEEDSYYVFSASPISRRLFEVTKTSGVCFARIVPSSGTEIW